MAEQPKDSNINEVWASAGDTGTDPGTGKRTLGFIQEKPTFQLMNHVLNLLQGFAKHANEQGIADWDATTNYALGGLTKGSDNTIYRSLSADNVGVDPVGENADWEIAFVSARNHQGNVGIGGGLSQWSSDMDVIQINDSGSIAVDQSGSMFLLINAYLDQFSNWRSFWTNPTPVMVKIGPGYVDISTSLTSGTNAAIAWDSVMRVSQDEFTVNGKDLIAEAMLIKTGGAYAPVDQTFTGSISFTEDGMSAIYLSYGTLYEVGLGMKGVFDSATYESSVGSFGAGLNITKAIWARNGNAIIALDTSTNIIRIYPVSTPWEATTADLSTAASTTFPLQSTNYKGIAQSKDGSVIYALSQATSGTVTFTITAYVLAAPFDYQNVAYTSSYTKPSQSFPVGNVYCLAISDDGKSMYVLSSRSVFGDNPFWVISIDLRAFNDMSSITLRSELFVDRTIGGVIYPCGIAVNDDGSRMAVIGRSTYGIKDFALVRGTSGV